MAVDGYVEPGFEMVRRVFIDNFEQRGEVGAALCVYQRGRPVVDLWGGTADRESGRPWTEDTTCRIDSTTKALTAICALMLVEQGELDLDAPVAEYWPGFAAAGKQDIPVRLVLTHQAGLPVVDRWVTLDDLEAWHPFIDALEQQRPYWRPGSAHGYHAWTFGWIMGELIRRVSGLTTGQFLHKHVAAPLGLDLWIGTPQSELHRVAPVIVDPGEVQPPDVGDDVYPLDVERFNDLNERTAALYQDADYLAVATDPAARTPEMFRRPFSLLQRVALGEVGFAELNSPRALAMEIPAANGVGSARSHARVYAALLDDIDSVRLLTPDTIARARRRHAYGPDLVRYVTAAWGLGFMVAGDTHLAGCGHHAFGHGGANGTVVFADPDHHLAFAYTRNRMTWALRDPRSHPLVRSVYDCADR